MLFAVWIAGITVAALIGAGILSVYIRQTECPSYHGGDPAFLGMNVMWTNGNWSIVIQSSPKALHPETTSAMIRGENNNTFFLEPTPWTSFTPATWGTYGILTVDNPPTGPLICEGDGLVVSSLRYPSRTVLGVLDRGTLLGAVHLN